MQIQTTPARGFAPLAAYAPSPGSGNSTSVDKSTDEQGEAAASIQTPAVLDGCADAAR